MQQEKEDKEEEERFKVRKAVKLKPPVPKAVIPAERSSSSEVEEKPVEKPDQDKVHMRGVFAVAMAQAFRKRLDEARQHLAWQMEIKKIAEEKQRRI